MMANVFKYSRRNSAGKLVKAKTYTGRFKLDGDTRYREVPLHCRDEQVARQKLQQIILQAEREREGLAVPLVQKECMAASLERLIEEYIAEKEKVGRSPNYTRVLNCRLSIVARECGWKILRSVSGQDFLQWRSSRSESPKTLNEYLSAWQGFLKWLSKRYGLPAIPAFECVERIDGRGRETYERRALTLEEAQRLLEVAPPARRLIYVLALSTGLRRAELDSLQWADVVLDDQAPYLRVRARNTKNRRDAMIPLIPQTAAILRATRLEIVCGDSAVIPGGGASESSGLAPGHGKGRDSCLEQRAQIRFPCTSHNLLHVFAGRGSASADRAGDYETLRYSADDKKLCRYVTDSPPRIHERAGSAGDVGRGRKMHINMHTRERQKPSFGVT